MRTLIGEMGNRRLSRNFSRLPGSEEKELMKMKKEVKKMDEDYETLILVIPSQLEKNGKERQSQRNGIHAEIQISPEMHTLELNYFETMALVSGGPAFDWWMSFEV